MTDIITWMTDIFSVELATIGTTPVTLGFMAAGSLVVGLVLSVFRRLARR